MRRRCPWIVACGGARGCVALAAGFVVLAALGSRVASTLQAQRSVVPQRPLEPDSVTVFGTTVRTPHNLGFGERGSGKEFAPDDSVADIFKHSSRIGDRPDHRASLASAVSAGAVEDVPWHTVILAEWGGGATALPTGRDGGLDESNVRGVMIVWRRGDCCEVGLWVPGDEPESLSNWERVESLSGEVQCSLITDEMDGYHAYVVPPGPDVEMRQIWLMGDRLGRTVPCDATCRIRDVVRDARGTEYAQRWLLPKPTLLGRAKRMASHARMALQNPGAAMRVVLD